MPDVYAAITDADVATQERLAVILELRAADGQQRAMLDSASQASSPPNRRAEIDRSCGRVIPRAGFRSPRLRIHPIRAMRTTARVAVIEAASNLVAIGHRDGK